MKLKSAARRKRSSVIRGASGRKETRCPPERAPDFSVKGLLLEQEGGTDVLVEVSRFVLGTSSMVRAFPYATAGNEPIPLSREEREQIEGLVSESLCRLRRLCVRGEGTIL